MRLPNEAHLSRPWRIHEIAPDFTVEDVWALPAHGGAGDFELLLEQTAAFDPARMNSLPSRILFGLREQLGRLLRLDKDLTAGPVHGDDALPIPGTVETSLAGRLPGDLRDSTDDLAFPAVPFVPLYRTDDEFAAEISNGTVHAVLHLGWVDSGDGRYSGQLAVLVKPRGALGRGYMQLIKPFRYLIVYPALMRAIERGWRGAPRREREAA